MERSKPQCELMKIMKTMKKIFLVLFVLPVFCIAQNPANSGYLFTKANGSVSIGTEVNTAPLTVSNTTSSFISPQTGTVVHVISSGVTNGRLSFDTYNGSNVNGSIYQGRRAAGTSSSPSAALADYTLVTVGGDGYGSTGFHNVSLGGMTVKSVGTMTDADAPTYMTFLTTPSGSTTAVERMRIKADGSIQMAAYGEGVFVTDASGNVSVISGTASQILRRNAGNTAYEFATISGAGTLTNLEET